jgi:phenylacetate-CoA ligase
MWRECVCVFWGIRVNNLQNAPGDRGVPGGIRRGMAVAPCRNVQMGALRNNASESVLRPSSTLAVPAFAGSKPRRRLSVDHAYASLLRTVLMPAWERVVRRRDTLKYLSYLEASQWISAEEQCERNTAALRALLAYAGEHVPYYREVFRKAGFDPRGVTSPADLEAVPLLTREIVRERYADLIDPAHRGKNLKKGTSGSTGVPLKFEYSMTSECWRQAVKLRGYGWAGYRPGLKTFYYWAVVSAAPPTLKTRIDRLLRRETFVDSMRQDIDSRREALNLLRKLRPSVVVCYTQSCAQFARWVLDEGFRDWDDVPVLCGAEAVLPGDRAVLTKAFGPEIFETYGSRETRLIAAECEAHDGMHVQEENLLVELVRAGRPVSPGETGDVVITDLHNFGMPLIRYVNGDMAVASGHGRCACGRGLTKIARVEGRRADAIRDRNGNARPGIVFHVLFSDARRELIRQFQAVQSKDGSVVLKVVRGREFSADAFQGLMQRFGEYLSGLPFSVEFHETIAPHLKSGKIQTIVVEKTFSRDNGVVVSSTSLS